jgi:membrane-bound lytic murein transglycosylase A
MVELLLKGSDGAVRISTDANPDPPSKPRPGGASGTAVLKPKPSAASEPAVPKAIDNAIAAKPVEEVVIPWTGLAWTGKKTTVFSSDPSYVFFRQIPDSEGGPVGALGVPLTAGRSVAVDPRTTPLGFPVFISTESETVNSRVNRLMFAQDTGGAIRGPVRADYFWGFGPNAGEMASRMKVNGRMWLLLPKDLRVAAGSTGIATRSVARAGGATEAECLVPDPDLCVE